MQYFLRTLALVLIPTFALAQAVPTQPIEVGAPRADLATLQLGKGNLAIDGWDPVAYFPEGGAKPSKGRAEWSLTYRGVVYRFASEANRKTFLAAPDRYEPAYGGWCAYAMADGKRVEIDPESFLIQDGELLLFYNGIFSNTRKSWGKEGPAKLRAKADAQWRKQHPGSERDLSGWHLTDGLALGGFDPVELVSDHPKAVPGQSELAWRYKGVTYRFANVANQTAFRLAPWSFEPALGGGDAVELAQGKSTAGVAQHALVHDKQLYVFANQANRDRFAADPATTLKAIAKAEPVSPESPSPTPPK
ncbi:MAG: hypothetical protein H6829_03390 [Planctomycetes bacterium]|nr:hypothetical protein [Planctomycetota bacterium]